MVDDRFLDLLSVTCGALDDARIIYAITGSVASSIHGEPFDSKDIDICLNMSEDQAKHLAERLPQRFYRSPEAMIEAAINKTMTNLLDSDTGFKVDLCVLPNDPFCHAVLKRRARLPYGYGGPEFWVVSPEDIVLMKLVWRKDSRSEKQWQNALSVVRTQFHQLDWKYLHTWADRLDVLTDLETLRRDAEA